MLKPRNDLTGRKFGRLTVTDVHSKVGRKYRWSCLCDCGAEKVVYGYNLTNGHTQSCGCLASESKSERKKTHGLRKHPLYHVWSTMRQRCNNPANHKFKDYGGRGIRVCQRWETSFKNFHDDMVEGYVKGLQIDRIDNNSGYGPDNCRWVTQTTNSRNRRNNHILTLDGESKCLGEWAEITGIQIGTLWYRVSSGWSPEKVVKTSVRV